MSKNIRVNEEKSEVNLHKEAIKKLGEKYVDWYYDKLANFKKFWVHEFVYPIVFPFLSLSITHYIFNFNFTREEGIILFMLFYLVTITGRLMSKYEKLVEVLDKRFDEIYKKK